MRMTRMTLCAALAALAAGCLNYDERIELNGDGSGVVRIHLAISEQMLASRTKPKIEKEEDLFPSPPKELVADLEKQGFKVRALRAESSAGMRHFYLVLEFKSLDDLAKSDLLGGRKVSLKREGDTWAFRSEIVVSEKTLDRAGGAKPEEPKPGPDGKGPKREEPSAIRQLEARFGKERVRQMFSAYSISFSVEMAGAGLLRTNGMGHRDAVAVWEIPLSQLIERKPTILMEADFAPIAAVPPEVKKP